MSESNLTFEQLENVIRLQPSVKNYISGYKRCYTCGNGKEKIDLYWHYYDNWSNKSEIIARCYRCVEKDYIKLSTKDEIVYLSFINNIIR
jgi:hypothetical protein